MLFLGFHKALPGGLSAGAYFQLMAWFVVLCGIAAWAKLRQEIPLVFAAPLGLMLFAMSAPYLAAVVQVPPSLNTSFYALHIGALFFSLALLALAFAAGALFLFIEGRIKSKLTMDCGRACGGGAEGSKHCQRPKSDPASEVAVRAAPSCSIAPIYAGCALVMPSCDGEGRRGL